MSTPTPHNDPSLQQSAQAEVWYAEVIVPLFIPKTLTWSIPSPLVGVLKPGHRVEVQLGKSKHYTGVVKRIHNQAPSLYQVKPLLNLLDDEPIVHPAQLDLWQWIASYYMCSEGEVMMAALPGHLKLTSESKVQYNEGHSSFLPDLPEQEYVVAEALEIKKELSLAEIQALLDKLHVFPVVKRLVDKGIAFVWETLAEKYKPRLETYVLLAPAYRQQEALEALLNEWKKSPKQLDLLLAFLHFERTEGQVTKSGLLKKANSSAAILQGLVAKQVLLLEKRAVDRLPTAARQVSLSFVLSAAQYSALQQLQAALQQHSVTLLHGVTGSGKTQLYIHLMAEVIKQGKQCLYLLPEIALTSQIIRKLRASLGGYVGVYHSKFNPNERVELWNKVKTGEIQIIVGARSALFLPFGALDLIIIDEEHDASFKQQEPAPRYHARDAAIYFARLMGARVVLGSATPAVETYHHALAGKYGLVTLQERFGDASLPAVEVIDLKQYPTLPGERVIVSPPLKEAIEQALNTRQQVILFQNRRGYTPYQVCTTCGWIPKCLQCDVSLNYHKSTQKLHCHYCGSSYPLVKECGACGHTQFRAKNFGTEKLEETLDTLLPNAVIARMDTDSVKGKTSHEALIRQFEEQRVQVLVGTQMVVKGLDFDHVGLVGIPDGDGLLNFSDFRVQERAFQMITQVSGRAGRRNQTGKVLIQLSRTNHPLIPFVLQHDYPGFYQLEIETRKTFFYPPFSRIILLQCRHRQQLIAYNAADTLTKWLRMRYEPYTIGPGEPGVNRVRNMYISETMLRLPPNQQVLQQAKAYIHQGMVELMHQPDYKQVFVSVNVDPL